MALEVILTPEQMKAKAIAVVEKVLADARHYCRNHTCRHCDSKRIHPVSVHSDLNPLFPEKIVIHCYDCGYSGTIFADAGAKKDEDYKNELERAGFKEAPKDLGEKLIIKDKN